jgi:hypothetical protein
MQVLLLLLVLGGIATLIAMLAMRVEGGPLDPSGPPGSTDGVRGPGTPISSLPFVINQPGHYYLTRNLNHGIGAAITISASNVSLDMRGFTLRGTDDLASYGILVTGTAATHFPVEIINGNIWDYAFGIDAAGAFARIDNVHVFSNGTGIRVTNHATVSNCTAALGTQYGIVVAGALSRVQNCMVVDNVLSGIRLEGAGNTVERSRVLRNDSNNSNAEGEIHILSEGFSTVIRESEILPFGQFDSIVKDFGASGIQAQTAYVIDSTICGITGTGSGQVGSIDNVTLCYG